MQMKWFLYCLKAVSTCVGDPGSWADTSAPPPQLRRLPLGPWRSGSLGEPLTPTCTLLTVCSQRTRSPSSQGIKLSEDTEAGVPMSSSCLPLAGYVDSDMMSNLRNCFCVSENGVVEWVRGQERMHACEQAQHCACSRPFWVWTVSVRLSGSERRLHLRGALLPEA